MLSGIRRRRIEEALVPPGVIADADSLSDLARQITAGCGDLLVLDPETLGTEMRVPDTVRVADIPAVLYVRVSIEAAIAAIAFARRAPADVVVLGCGDDVKTLAQHCARIVTMPCVKAFLESVSSTLERFPTSVRDGIEHTALGGNTFLSVERLAARCALDRSQLTRTLQQGGFVSTKRLVDALAVARQYNVLTSSSGSFTDVAHALGCVSPRSLDRKCLRLLGLSARDLRLGLPLTAFVTRLRAAVVVN